MIAKPKTRRPLLAALALSALLPAGHAAAQVEASFGDWVAACDNTRVCRAIGFSGGAENYGWIRIDRPPAANARASIAVVLDFDTDAKQLPVEARFDEPGFEAIFQGTLTLAPDDSGRFALKVPPAMQANFMAALKKANKLTVRRLDPKAKPDGSVAGISLKGSIAALRWLDDQQKRAGTVTALVATGGAAASAIPRAPSEPVIRRSSFRAKELKQKPPAAVMAGWKDACDEWDERKDSEISGYRIGQGLQLWQMPCSRGAYNFGSMFFLLNEAGKAEHLKFDQWKAPHNGKPGQMVRDDEELINAGFDPQSRSIGYFSKGRGIGDCGRSATFVWDGSRFRLTEFRAMGECKGVPADDWPTIWRAKVLP